MKKLSLILTICVLCLLAGCAAGNNTAAPASLNDGGTQAEGIGFRYFYHGFLIENSNGETAIAPEETYIIETQEKYDNFVSLYDLSSIYPLDTVDFAQECLIYSGSRSAQGIRGWSGKIQEIRVTDSGINLVADESVNYEGEHQEDAVAYQMIGAPDCAVREVYLLIVQKADLPEKLYGQYQPSLDF